MRAKKLWLDPNECPELEGVLAAVYDEIKEQETQDMIDSGDEYAMECTGQVEVDPDELNDLVADHHKACKSRPPRSVLPTVQSLSRPLSYRSSAYGAYPSSVRTICPGGADRKAPKTRKGRCGNDSVAAVFIVADGRKCLKSKGFRAKRKERQFYQNYRSSMARCTKKDILLFLCFRGRFLIHKPGVKRMTLGLFHFMRLLI